MTRQNMAHARRTALLTAAALANLPALSTLATERHWNATSGTWGISANWSPTGVPSGADLAVVDFWNFTTGQPGFASVPNNVGTTDSVRISTDNTVRIGAQGVLGSVNDVVVGFDNTGGTLNVTNTSPVLPYFGRLNVGRELRIGDLSGPGTVNQNDGTVTVGEHVYVGSSRQPGSKFPGVGTYNLGGGLLTSGEITVGRLAPLFSGLSTTGHFNLFGGTAQTGFLYVGGGPWFPGGIGVVNQTGGTMDVWRGELLAGCVYNLSGGSYHSTDATQVWNGIFNYSGGSCYIGGSLYLRHNARVQLSGPPGKVLQVNFLSMFEDSVVDLNEDSMIVASGTQSLVRGQIISGRNGGLWNGPGITSSAAAADVAHLTSLGYAVAAEIFGGFGGVFEGVAVGPDAVLVKYTWYGDTDLNGVVNFDDYARIDAGFNTGGDTWFEGDFNYDGGVNFDDYALIDLAFNSQSGTLRSIPEPALISTFVGAPLLLCRRRRFKCFDNRFTSRSSSRC